MTGAAAAHAHTAPAAPVHAHAAGPTAGYVSFAELWQTDLEEVPWMDGWTWFTYLNLLPIALHTLIHVGCVVDVPGTLEAMSDGKFTKTEVAAWPRYLKHIFAYFSWSTMLSGDLIVMWMLVTGVLVAKQTVALVLPVYYLMMFLSDFVYTWTGETPKLTAMPFPVIYTFTAMWATGFALDDELRNSDFEKFYDIGFTSYYEMGKSPFKGFDELKTFCGVSLLFTQLVGLYMFCFVEQAGVHVWGANIKADSSERVYKFFGHLQAICIGSFSLPLSAIGGLMLCWGHNFVVLCGLAAIFLVFNVVLTQYVFFAKLRPALKDAASSKYGSLLS